MATKTLRKGILSTYTHYLTPDQRVEYERLRRAGMSDIQARDLAVAVDTATKRVGKSGFDESQHPRDNAGKFDASGGGGDGPKPVGTDKRKTPFDAQDSRQHAKEGQKSLAAAQKALDKGHAEKAAEHMANAKAHTDAIQRATESAKQNGPVTPEQLDHAFVHVSTAFVEHGRDAGHAALASLAPHVRDALVGRDRQVARQERQQDGMAKSDAAAQLAVDMIDLAKSAYSEAYVQSAKEQLSPWQHGQIRAQARARAGGKQSGTARRGRADASNAALLAQRKVHMAAIADIDQQVAKAMAPSMGQLHVPQLLKVPRKKKRKNDKKTIAKTAELDPAAKPFVDAQRLIAGIDFELNGGRTLDDARAIVSDLLDYDLRTYDATWPLWWLPNPTPGIQLDINSGAYRQPGMLGVDTDLASMDYGTIIHDVRTGLPVPPVQAISALRLSDADSAWTDDELTALLRQAQVAMNYGGRLLWESQAALGSRTSLKLLPGFDVVHDGHTDDGRHQTVLERVRRDVPMAYGADAANWGRKEETPADLALVYAALSASEHPQLLMANLVHKRDQVPAPEHLHQPIVSDAPHKQIVWGLIYEPDVVDSQGDYMSAEDIEDAAHQAMRDGIAICQEHDGVPIQASVVESFIAPADFTMSGRNGSEQVTKGSWLMGVHIADPSVWQGVLRGDFQGFSMGGFAAKKGRFARTVSKTLHSGGQQEANVPNGRRLKGVKIVETSLVKRGANNRNWSVIKSADAEQKAIEDLRQGAMAVRPQVTAIVERLSKAASVDKVTEGFSPHEKVATTAIANIAAQLPWDRSQWDSLGDSLFGDPDDEEEADEEDEGDSDGEGLEDDQAADYQDDSSYERDSAILPVGKAKANPQTPTVDAEAENAEQGDEEDDASGKKGAKSTDQKPSWRKDDVKKGGPGSGPRPGGGSGSKKEFTSSARASAGKTAAEHLKDARKHEQDQIDHEHQAKHFAREGNEPAKQEAIKNAEASRQAAGQSRAHAAYVGEKTVVWPKPRSAVGKTADVAPNPKIADHRSQSETTADAAAPAVEQPVAKSEETPNADSELLAKSRDELANTVKELLAKSAKQDGENAELRQMIKRQEDRRVMSETLAEVEREYPHIAGTAQEKAELLKSLRENEALKPQLESLEKSWKAANAQLGGINSANDAPIDLFRVAGSPVAKSARGGASAEIDQVVSQAIAKGDKRSREQIYVDTLKSNPELVGKLGMGGV